MGKAHRNDLLDAVGAHWGRTDLRRWQHHGGGHGGGHGESISLDQLESRTLMSGYTYASFAEHFNLTTQLRDMQAPTGATYEGFGYAAATLGDLDADGVTDFAVSAPGSNPDAGTTAGAVFVFSGRTGSLIRTLSDNSPGFGFALADVGDINGDGFDDLLVGSPRFDANGDSTPESFGRFVVYSGMDGASLRTAQGDTAADELGFSVTALGDVNNDGIPDYAVGAPGAGQNHEGQVHIYSGMDGAIIRTLAGEAAGQRFGAAILGTGDLGASPGTPGDGIGDILVGAPGSQDTPAFQGKVYLFNGANGNLVWSVTGERNGDGFGSALGISQAGANRSIIYVSSPGFDAGATSEIVDAGRVYRLQQDGSLMTDVGPWIGDTQGGHFGASITQIGDVNGDGVNDIGFSVPGAASGHQMRFFSGQDTHEFALPSAGTALMGAGAFALGDVNNDGFVDIGVWSPTSGHFAVLSSLALLPPTTIDLSNGSGSWLFANAAGNPANGRMGVVLINNTPLSYSRVPGLAGNDVVLGVAENGDMIVRQAGGGLYLIRSGTRTALADAFSNEPTDPAPNLSSFQFAGMSSTGDILFTDTNSGVTRAWVLHQDTLTFLWNGTVRSINSSGQVLGVRDESDGSHTLVLRSADGNTVAPVNLTDAFFVTNAGVVIGVDANGNLTSVDSNGTHQLSVLAIPNGSTAQWQVLGQGVHGELLLRRTLTTSDPNPVSTSTDYVYTTDVGLQDLNSATFDVDAGENISGARFMTANGTIISDHGFRTVVSNDAPWVGANGAPLWSSAGTATLAVVGVNQYGDAILMRRSGTTWSGWRLNIVGLENLSSFTINDALVWTDSETGRNTVFLVTDHGVYSALRMDNTQSTLDATLLNLGEGTTQIVDHATVFATHDRRVHLAGTDSAGELVIYFNNDVNQPGVFTYDNLTRTHIASQGSVYVPVASNIVALNPSWNATHLFYLGSDGSVMSVWIAEGLTYWVSTNLTDAVTQGGVGADPSLALNGHITAYATPWDGLNVAGAGTDGDPTAVWWVPQFGGSWRHSKIYGFEGQAPIAFDPNSASAYVTSWGGLNIATIDSNTGEIKVFWWVPGFDEWHAETLTIRNRPDNLTFNGPLTTSVSGNTLNIFARGSDSDIYRIFWNPGDGGLWNIQNVTESVQARA